MTPEARIYLNEALDFIQENSIMREHIDWQAWRQEVEVLATQAQAPVQTYPAIKRALELLGDHHSFFREPEEERKLQEGKAQDFGFRATYLEGIIGLVVSQSPAEKAELRAGDRILSINGQPFAALTSEQRLLAFNGTQVDLTFIPAGKKTPHSVRLHSALYPLVPFPQGQRLEHNTGYLDLPGILSGPEQARAYAERAQQIIAELDQAPVSKWVIDLRRNIGGNMFPMVVGVGPILGEGECVSFVAPWDKKTVFYREGKASIGEDVIIQIDPPYLLSHPRSSVAVLTSPLTISSGEFVALAFRGMPNTRSFGEPTRGLPTSNDYKKLSDGAGVLLTTHLGGDRVGRSYNGPLVPDQLVKIDWRRLGTADDPVLQAALQWLQTEKDCL